MNLAVAFAVLLADELFDARPGVTAQLAARHAQTGHAVLGVLGVAFGAWYALGALGMVA